MPTFRIFISPEELIPGRIVTYDEVAAVAANLNRSEALHFFGFLNLLLSTATAEAELTGTVEPLRDVQTYVFREVVSADLLRRLKERFASASLMDRPDSSSHPNAIGHSVSRHPRTDRRGQSAAGPW